MRPGTTVPCSICGAPTPPSLLTECWLPAVIAEVVPGVEITPLTAVWVCPACPIVGEVKS